MIILDNEKYHKTYDRFVPKSYKMKKQACIDYLKRRGEKLKGKESAVQLKVKVREYISKNVLFHIQKLAGKKGHEVVYTPAYHSDLQPIEYVWAQVKGKVGRQYDDNTTLSIFYQRLKKEFEELQVNGSELIGRMINKSSSLAKEIYDKMDQDDGEEQLELHVNEEEVDEEEEGLSEEEEEG